MESDNNLSVAGIVLAAGVAKRFGSDKRLAALPSSQQLHSPDSNRLLAATITSIEPFCTRIFVALKPEDSAVAADLLGSWYNHPKIQLCCAPRASEGMGSSLSDALDCVKIFGQKTTSSFDAVMIMLGDMPFVQRATFQTLIKNTARNTMTFPCYLNDSSQESWGHPVIFGNEWFAQLKKIEGDQGGRKILAAFPDACRPIVVTDAGVCRDVDTPVDLL